MEENTIGKLLDEEIIKTLQTVCKTTDMDSDVYKAAMGKLKALHDQRMRELEAEQKRLSEQNANEAKLRELHLKQDELKLKDQQSTRENNLRSAELDATVRRTAEELKIKETELAQKDAELKEAKRSRRWRTVLDLLGIAVPTGASCYWMYKGMKFEEEGKIYTSRTGRWLSEHLKLFRK